ncbi:1-(5-phosphoribosyl)-5-[(5-phosphoribosylamino)methylideneamino]imidazole-4-carboxamide isomerase [Paenibacillus sp. HN-1]|uniref:1-(5-phosphoribosyl)-5-[(5- phosphoribosylamino)methylideneamino]imidazole-4- carboxamide isomerase n=1 Tax=Paenibacillus TaxID=44249 RepID=UPI001CA8DFBA|nr:MULTISPECIES: 1-(5-phosphoribosyl)-5-[(5-phosphoribosylamino)methylideneamino]imidazole-4-carboxamide isomerase [Paenibacillus]MBY9078972.1 1-(5-phosphoribosyl)-5-[(5-phosphoribosylamino)methylideneamino]imidazole-4-carboxamide isomerase [Paenibacillus sp. CGMCC 1.18879]MBY9084350.1 1-(5-phosphoribosyl)-5-[(5-phosphoribosylamino)methylideneamino]imidazole-4-carboxamide isomerase [Paenibacillus sinensis]
MSSFIVYPAIDIRNGKCVRLLQGDYNQETVYGESPLEMAKSWESQGGEFIHLVDLDGAKAGHPVNVELIGSIAKGVQVPVQVGGGLRTLEDVEKLLSLGVIRVIIGTAAINDRAFTESVLAKYGSKVAIGIDARNGYVATHGWLNTSEVLATELAKELASKGAETFIYTDISRDGMMQGPNIEGIIAMAQASGKSVIASGGVTSQDDLVRLRAHSDSGIGGAIVGKALYTGNIKLPEALAALK